MSAADQTHPDASSGHPADPGHWRLRVDYSDRRVRALVAGRVLADSRQPRLVYETGRHPTYYLPTDDVDWGLLEPSPYTREDERKGPANFWHLRDGDRTIRNAVWRYADPPAAAAALGGLNRVAWSAVDAWYEEDEQIHYFPRDPYRRVDALRSSRHIAVHVDGCLVGETTQPVLLFETGLPTRYYLPQVHVDLRVLLPSDTITGCQYKGRARYWSARVNGQTHPDVAWSYPDPIPAVAAIGGHLAFDAPAVTITIDGEPRLVR